MEGVEFVSGEAIVSEGEEGDAMYFVLSGTAQAEISWKSGGSTVVASYREGATQTVASSCSSHYTHISVDPHA